MRPCHQEVQYSNGDVEPMIGEVILPVKVQGVDMPMRAFVLYSKGPSLIMGFTFLEANRLLMDCVSPTLTNKDGGASVKCLPLQTDPLNSTPLRVAAAPPTCLPTQPSPEALVIQRFPINVCLPLLRLKKFSNDATFNFFTPTELHLLPGERLTVDTGIAYHFPRDSWCLLREKSRLAHK